MLPSDKKPFQETAQQVERVFGLDKEEFGRVIQRVSSLVPETEAIYETDLLADPEAIVDQAREVLMIRNLHAMQEITQLRDTADSLSERARELEEESRRDPLTGVYNRTYLEQYLRQEFDQASRNDWPLSIAFCDLDGFKKVNDTYGHQAGDKVLKTTAAILKNSVRRVDVVARYGGEEFVLVLPATDRDIARTVCERIVQSFQTTRHDIGPQPVSVTVSIGYATHGGGQRFANVEALVKAADQALYTAKLQGRNRFVRYEAGERAPVVQFL